MFNFYKEIKDKSGISPEFLHDFNLVNISGRLLYVEGHGGVSVISPNLINFKVKNGRVIVEGSEFVIKELTENTLLISGKIAKMEIF